MVQAQVWQVNLLYPHKQLSAVFGFLFFNFFKIKKQKNSKCQGVDSMAIYIFLTSLL